MNIDIMNLIQIMVILFVAIYLMLKASFSILEKRNIFIFLPVFLVGLEMCFEAAFFYFKFPLSSLPGQLHDVFLIFLLAFYTFIFWRKNAN